MRYLLFLTLMLQFLMGCNSNDQAAEEIPPSENDLDAARNFIRASLDRKWNEARKFMLQDSANLERLEQIEEFYMNENREERRGYREASITTYDSRKINDSATIIQYSNSFKNKRDSLKVVRINNQWLVDLKYSFLPPDSVNYDN